MEYELFSLLNEWGAVNKSRLSGKSDKALEERLKIQKAAYLLLRKN